MKVASFMIVGPGEGGRYLAQALKQLWVDEICICLNNTDEETERIAKQNATYVCYDNREWGKEQWRIKQQFLDNIIKDINPDWIWALDSDEIFDPRFTRAEAERLMAGKDVAFYFWCLQLWNSDDMVRTDLSFPNIRFYKVVPELGLHFQATALHCGLAPRYAYQWGSQTNFYFKHHGLKEYADRRRKVERYAKYDPTEKYKGRDWYAALRNEKVSSKPIEQVIADLPGEILKRKDIKKMAKRDKEVFMFRNPHGKVVPAVGKMQREQFIKMKFTELQSISVNPNPEAPVMREEPGEEAPVEIEDDGSAEEQAKAEFEQAESEAQGRVEAEAQAAGEAASAEAEQNGQDNETI